MKIIRTGDSASSRGGLDFLRHVFQNHIFESSATLSYYFLFSIFPLAIVISAAFSTLNVSPDDLNLLVNLVPERILVTLRAYLREISLGNTATLMITGVILTLYSMGKAIQTMRRKFRQTYEHAPTPRTFNDWIVSFVFVFLMIVSFYATLILIVAGNYLFSLACRLLPGLVRLSAVFQLLRVLLVTLYLFFVLFGLYYILPGIKLKKRDIIPGTLFALTGWILLSYLFSFYIDHFSNYTTLYGSLGAIIMLLTWLFFLNFILIVGSRINSYLYLKKKSTND